jgi:uncharacterized protein Usg
VRLEPELPNEFQDSIKQLQYCNNEFEDKYHHIHYAHTRLLWLKEHDAGVPFRRLLPAPGLT